MSKLRVPVSARDHISGGHNAIVTLVEYGDYQCPHCAAAQPNVRRVQAQFGDRLALVYRHFPLTEIHPHALVAAETAEFAGEHGLLFFVEPHACPWSLSVEWEKGNGRPRQPSETPDSRTARPHFSISPF